MSGEGLSRLAVAGAVIGIVLAAVVLLWNLAAGAFSCSEDTSYCAQSQDKNGLYTGQLLLDGQPYANRPFEVAFESRGRARLDRVTFRTSSDGRYCIVWASEAITPFPYTPAGVLLQNAGEEEATGLRNWQPLSASPPAGCQEGDGGIPWYRAEGLTSTWEYIVLLIVPLASAGFLVTALRRRRRSDALTPLRLGWTLVAMSIFLLWFLWSSDGLIALAYV